MQLETAVRLYASCVCNRRGMICNTRCDECLVGSLTCQQCFVECHWSFPFHWASVWNMGYFVRCSYSDLGGVLHLGHGGLPCEHAIKHTGARDVTITHTNSIHKLKVSFCECFSSSEHWKQLLQHRFFLATLAKPQTVFTFELLKLCHDLSHGSKAVMYDILMILRCLTNDVFYLWVLVSDDGIITCVIWWTHLGCMWKPYANIKAVEKVYVYAT